MHLVHRIVLIGSLAIGAIAFGAETFDVVVCGGTPGGIGAAVTAARLGRSVALVEYHPHLGGMSASGLGKSDVETREAIGGIWREFTIRVRDHYVKAYGAGHENVKLCRDGYYYEPAVAEKIFGAMIAEQPKIRVFLRHELQQAERSGKQVVAIQIRDRSTGELRELRGSAFIDATYEGDLAAAAGAAYRTGRESRRDFNELHAGVVYMDHTTRTFLAGTTGEGDSRLQAYTFRLCLTDDPANSHVLTAPPPEYDRKIYLGYFDDLKSGRLGTRANPTPPRAADPRSRIVGTMLRAMTIAPIPNRKYDANMFPRALAYPFVGENTGYPDARWPERERITARLRNLTLGLLWFVQNDPDIPEDQRALARQFNLAKDEFADHGHFPWQLYVREARRIIGEYTLSERDVFLAPESGRPPIHADSIAAGEYPIDSMPTRKREAGHDVSLEGYVLMLSTMTRPYQLPYRILVPKEIDGLLVPVAASTTHVAFSSIRLEPTWMVLGQAAAIAAHQALRDNVPVRRVNIPGLQRELLQQGQVLTYFKDMNPADPAFRALQYFGTRGFFPDYFARAGEPLTRATAREWLGLALNADTAAKLSRTFEGDGNVTRADLGGLVRAADWKNVSATEPGGTVVSRGEFCTLLFSHLP